MPKIKTKKTVSKRFKLTKKGKIKKITGGQNHFNARESGKTRRNKRRDTQIAKADHKTIRRSMPYS